MITETASPENPQTELIPIQATLPPCDYYAVYSDRHRHLCTVQARDPLHALKVAKNSAGVSGRGVTAHRIGLHGYARSLKAAGLKVNGIAP
ncbi:MAG: hypothetical protein SFV32_12570 [Opitutaceae bacterium]|nr:hypothetical protein [Opitutaceae bacterium]